MYGSQEASDVCFSSASPELSRSHLLTALFRPDPRPLAIYEHGNGGDRERKREHR